MSLGSYLKNNRPRSIVLTVVFVLACLVFVVGVVCVFSITQMMGSRSSAETPTSESRLSASGSTVSSSFQGSGEAGESVILTEEELDAANANIRARNNSMGRRPSSGSSNTTSTYYTTSQNWYGDDDEDNYYYTSRLTASTGSSTSRYEEEPTTSTPDEPITSTPEEPTTSTPEEPSTSTPEQPSTSAPEQPSTSTPEGTFYLHLDTPSVPETSTPNTPDEPHRRRNNGIKIRSRTGFGSGFFSSIRVEAGKPARAPKKVWPALDTASLVLPGR